MNLMHGEHWVERVFGLSLESREMRQASRCCHYWRPTYRVLNLKVDRILIRVIYLLRFTTQLTCTYSKCWKWCPFISMHLSTCFTMFLATFLSVLSFFNHFSNSTFYWRLPSKFFIETLSTVGIRHRFQNKYTFSHCWPHYESVKNGVVQTPALTVDWFNWYGWLRPVLSSPRTVLPTPAHVVV